MRWWPILLLLVLVGVFWPAVFTGEPKPGAADDPVWFSDFHADYVVSADGRLSATERITAEFPGGRHGLFEFWRIATPAAPRVRQVPTVTRVLVDGQPMQYEMQWDDSMVFRIAKIGDPNRYLDPGTHVFEISYQVAGALAPASVGDDLKFATSTGDVGDARTVFYWNVIGSWNNPIDRATATVTLPDSVTGTQCSIGFGVGQACDELTAAGNKVTVSAAEVPPRTPVTIRAGLDVPPPARAELPWTYRFDRVLGRSVTTATVLVGAAALAGALGYLWWRRTVEPSPGFPLQYAPPDGLGPVQTEYIRTEDVPRTALTATLFYLAERGVISLTQTGESKWTVRGVGHKEQWDQLDPVSREVGEALDVNTAGAEFKANGTVTAGKKLSQAKTDVVESAPKWALGNGFLVKKRAEQWVRVVNLVALIGTVCGVFRWGFPITLWALPFAVFFVVTARSWKAGVGTRRTSSGRELWSRAGGFHRVLSTDSAESRFDFGARKDLYTAYIPFAVAAGAAALWAKKYETATGEVAPQPGWYHTTNSTRHGYTSSGGGANFDSFESAVSASIGAYSATQRSSSSSGGGGGGFSGGGGGGGGGGGSW